MHAENQHKTIVRDTYGVLYDTNKMEKWNEFIKTFGKNEK